MILRSTDVRSALRSRQRGLLLNPFRFGGGGGGGSSLVVSTYDRGGNATNHSVTLPSGIVAGELLVVLYSVDGNPTLNSVTSGWTATTKVTDSGNGVSFFAFSKVAAGSDVLDLVFSVAENACAICIRASGKSNFQISTINQASTANPDPPSLSPSGGTQSYIWLAGVAIGSDATTVSSGSSGYDAFASAVATGGTSNNNTRIHAVKKETTASSENPGSYTISPSGTNLAFTAAIW